MKDVNNGKKPGLFCYDCAQGEKEKKFFSSKNIEFYS